MVDQGSEPLIEALALVAPGTPLRNGLDRILQAKRGALVVVGDDPVVLSICTGGFLLDAEFSPQRLSELAKMDGAIILASDASRIARANVHLVPKASIPTSETGTRHRTAERVARSIDVPVVTVSEAMATVTVFRHARKHTLQRTGRLVDRAAQAISTVQRFKTRFDFALASLSTLEVEDAVSVRDVVDVLQPGEMVVRFAEEIDGYLVELGEDGRLIHLQMEELGAGLETALRLVVMDYVAMPAGSRSKADGRAELDRRAGRGPGRAARPRVRGPPRPGPGGGRPRAGRGPGRPRHGRGGPRLPHPAPAAPGLRPHHRADRGAVRHPPPHPAGLAGGAREGGRGRAWPRPARSRTAWPGWSRRASSSASTDRSGVRGAGESGRMH